MTMSGHVVQGDHPQRPLVWHPITVVGLSEAQNRESLQTKGSVISCLGEIEAVEADMLGNGQLR